MRPGNVLIDDGLRMITIGREVCDGVNVGNVRRSQDSITPCTTGHCDE